MKELKLIEGAKALHVHGTTIYFDNGYSVDVHEYETYVDIYVKENLSPKELKNWVS